MKQVKRKWWWLFAWLLMAVILICCGKNESESPFENISNKSAQYVGMNECKQCHANIYQSFMRTGMGKSWGLATRQKSAANFSPEHALVYDSALNFYYKPFWQGDSLYVMEFRLDGKDTVHKRIEKITYIVGSGQHTNSHLIDINGYLHQAPITFYTQKGQWDLAPGFEKGQNTRFERKIEMECITCHNGYPELVEGSLNKYAQVPLGIDCERCHGPGSLHVNAKRNADIVDTATQTDYTIVNPKKLSIEEQNNLCQRCHLQGITVLNEGKTFFDFKPSQRLKNTMHTFMPVYSEDENNMIMASHVERMKLSKCYTVSAKMSCITCHNPHVSVKETAITTFNAACKNCHKPESCKEDIAKRQPEDNCSGCHMPKNSSIDIPHVAVTDHLIRVAGKAISQNKIQQTARFIQMKCYNNDDVDDRTLANAFLEFYERYQPDNKFIDSALYYLEKAGLDVQKSSEKEVIRSYFLLNNFNQVVALCEDVKVDDVEDAWTAYRIGEAYLHINNINKAIDYLQRAVTLKPLFLDFQHKYAHALLKAKRLKDAEQVCLFILKENPRYALANFNLGFVLMQGEQWKEAQRYFEMAKHLNPDHVQTLINLSVIYYRLQQTEMIKPLLKHALKLEPGNAQVIAMLQDLGA